ncbi:hypothetical protein [Streptomyces sp. NPDC005046]
MHSLVYRCRELGLISDATASRTYQRLRALDGQPGFAPEPVSGYPGEQPVLLSQAFDRASMEPGYGELIPDSSGDGTAPVGPCGRVQYGASVTGTESVRP